MCCSFSTHLMTNGQCLNMDLILEAYFDNHDSGEESFASLQRLKVFGGIAKMADLAQWICFASSIRACIRTFGATQIYKCSLVEETGVCADCWMIKRSVCLLKQISCVEIVSTCSAAASCGCRSSRVFYAVDSATLQPVHRCTPAPHGMLAVPAVLPTHSFGDVDHW